MGYHCDQHHLTLDFLLRVREGRIPLSIAFGHLLGHLSELCPTCRHLLEQSETDYQLDKTAAGARVAVQRALKTVSEAKRDLVKLDQQANLDSKIALAERARTKMRSRHLVELLLERAQQRLQDRSLTDALDDCRLAEAISRRIPDSEAGPGGSKDLVVLVRAHLSNVLRIAQRPEAADAILAPLLAHVSDMIMPSMEAEVLSLAASLRISQCRYDEALGLLHRELSIYQIVEDDHAEGRTLVQIARVHFGRGNLRRAVATARASLEKIDPAERRDLLAAVHNLAHYLEAAGEVLEACELIESHSALYQQFSGDALLQGRLSWLYGRVLERRREDSHAEANYRHTRSHFLEHGLAYSAALVTLDLARLLLNQHRFAEVQVLAEESGDVLAKGSLHEHASEAFDLFRQAALAEALSVAELMRIADYLRRAERDPGLRFTGVS